MQPRSSRSIAPRVLFLATARRAAGTHASVLVGVCLLALGACTLSHPAVAPEDAADVTSTMHADAAVVPDIAMPRDGNVSIPDVMLADAVSEGVDDSGERDTTVVTDAVAPDVAAFDATVDDAVPVCAAGEHACGTVCVSSSSPATCGTACDPCQPRPDENVGCNAGLCVYACAAGRADCNGVATDGCEAVPANDVMNCGTCGTVCADGEECREGACMPPRPVAPRLLSPLSTSFVTSQRPSLRWATPAGTDGTRVQVCSTRACASPLLDATVTTTSYQPATALAAGVYYWRVFGRRGTTEGVVPSAVWQFQVGARSAVIDRSYGSTGDIDLDGRADVVVGAPGYSSDTGVPGAAYVFRGSQNGLSAPAVTLTNPAAASSEFGAAVAIAGDVNGDGFADVAVGADDARGQRGAVYVYLGSASGIADTVATTLVGTVDDGHFGRRLAGAGDVNGDGYGDLVVAAPTTGASAGTVYVYLGGANGLETTPAYTLAGLPGESFGFTVAGNGDVNGDGYADVAVGADQADIGTTEAAGRVYVFTGSATGISSGSRVALAAPDTASEQFGAAVAIALDTNGDGYDDVVVGAPGYASATGRAFVFAGGASGPASGTSVTLDAPADADGPGAFGTSVAAGGDTNGDGYDDVLVSAPNTRAGGSVCVFAGGASAFASPRVLSGASAYERFGAGIAGGDVDGNGYADVVVGADLSHEGNGRLAVYAGAANGTASAAFFTLDGSGGNFGAAVASGSH